ncbi:immunoglobulin domain-containing protein [Roseibacillus persicicus]|uniref:immunoglobulin domain-containing protein n=1 Tax=Roseibacillus persicicus TaxID=454148 RepID=UPI00398ABD0F
MKIKTLKWLIAGGLVSAPLLHAQITYVDADLTNTLVGGNSPVAGGNITSPDRPNGDNLWAYDNDSNFANPTPSDGAVWAGGSNDTGLPELTTTMTGLVPSGLYEVYTFGWTAGTTWDMSAGLQSGTLTQFRNGPAGRYFPLGNLTADASPNPSTSSEVTINGVTYSFSAPLETSEDNRDLYLCVLGLTFADGSGNIPVYINTYDGGDRTWYDGVGYRQITSPPVTPSSATVTLGEDVTFDATIVTTASLSYQWQKNGTDLPGETNSTLTIAAADEDDIANYSTVISHSGGTISTSAASLSVTVPAVTPSQQVGLQGTSASFSIAMPATQTYTYQWRKDGTPIAGAAADTLVIENIATGDAGSYDVLVSLAGNAVASSAGGQLVVPALPSSDYPGTILADSPVAYLRLGEGSGATEALDETTPQNNFPIGQDTVLETQGAILGSSNTAMTFDAAGDSALWPTSFDADLNPAVFSVEFWAKPTGGTGVRTVFGSRVFETTENITGYEVGLDSAGRWNFQTGQGDLTGTGSNAWNTLTGPTAATNLWSHVVATCDGTQMALYVNGLLAGTLPITNFVPQTSWESRIGAGANEEATPGDLFTGDIDEVAFYGSVLSGSQVLAHYVAAFDPTALPRVAERPTTQTTLIGESTTLTVSAESGAALSYQWRKNGVDIPGANSATLTLSSVAVSDAGDYDVIVSNTNGSVTSDATTLVPLQDYLGTIVIPDENNTVLVEDDTITWFATTEASSHSNGLWFQRGVFGILPSISPYGYQTTAATLGSDTGGTELQTTITGLTPNTDYAVWTLLSYKPGFSTGLQAAFAGEDMEPILIAEMIDTGLGSVALPGSGGDTWNILHGLLGVKTSDSNGEIKVNVDYLPGSGRTVYNGLGYQLAVPAASAPLFTIAPRDASVLYGNDVTFSASASSVEAITYQWQKDGVDIPGATASTFSLTEVDETDAGVYTVVATNSQGSTTSTGASLVTILDYIGTFVFPDSSNTVLTRNDSSTFFSNDQATAETDGLWTEITDAIVPGLSTASYLSYRENENVSDVDNELRTTISGLTPGEKYAVWLLFGFQDGGDRISAGLDGNALITFEETLASDTGLDTGATGTLDVFHGLLGVREADSNGEISALIDFNGLNRSFYLGLGYQTAILSVVPDVTIDIETIGGVPTITWPTGTLQQNEDLSNPTGWTPVPGAVSPYQVPTSSPANFFRVVR